MLYGKCVLPKGSTHLLQDVDAQGVVFYISITSMPTFQPSTVRVAPAGTSAVQR